MQLRVRAQVGHGRELALRTKQVDSGRNALEAERRTPMAKFRRGGKPH